MDDSIDCVCFYGWSDVHSERQGRVALSLLHTSSSVRSVEKRSVIPVFLEDSKAA